jgi:hypothetical protein
MTYDKNLHFLLFYLENLSPRDYHLLSVLNKILVATNLNVIAIWKRNVAHWLMMTHDLDFCEGVEHLAP